MNTKVILTLAFILVLVGLVVYAVRNAEPVQAPEILPTPTPEITPIEEVGTGDGTANITVETVPSTPL